MKSLKSWQHRANNPVTEENFHRRPEKGSLRLFLVRHGETDANRRRVLQGTSNGPLNATGRQQAGRLGSHLENVALDHVFASDLQRAVDTAYAVVRMHGLEVEVDSLLREWDVGDLDGQPAAMYLQMIKDNGGMLSRFHPPGGQKLCEVRDRADEVIRKITAEHLGEAVMVCSHGDFLRQVVGSILQIDIDTATAFYFDNASYSVFEFADQHWKVVAINRTATPCEHVKEKQ